MPFSITKTLEWLDLLANCKNAKIEFTKIEYEL
jgi:hypothetical protein